MQPYHSPPIGSFRNCTIAALWIFLQFTIFTIYMECRWISVNLYYSLERTRYYPLFSTILLPLWFKIHIISFLRDSSYGFVFNFCYPPPSPHYQTILLSPKWIQSVICLIISLWNRIFPPQRAHCATALFSSLLLSWTVTTLFLFYSFFSNS